MGCCGDEPKESGDKPRPNPISRKNVCCTDIIALILFVAFVGLMVYIAVLSIMKGDARRLVFGYDSFGNTCYQDNSNNPITNVTDSGRNLKEMENVFFMNVFDPFDAMQICVKVCPNKDLITPEQVKQFAKDTGSRLCHYNVSIDDYGDLRLYDGSGKGLCPKLPIFKSVSILQRCAPDPAALIGLTDKVSGSSMDNVRKNATDSFFRIFELDSLFRKVLSDLYMSWREIIILCVLAIVISFLVVLMIRYLAAVIVWLIVVLAALGSLVGTAFLWWTFVKIHKNLDERETWKVPLLGIEISNEKAFLIFSIIASVLTLILLLILLILRKRISLAVALFKEAGKCVLDLPSLLVQPIWTFLILAAFFAYWLAIMAFIGTAGHPVSHYERGFQSVEFVLEGFASHFWWIHLIGLIWISEVILACQQFVIGGSVARWYFTRDKKQLGCVCCATISSLILHHIGSVAAGALIITLVKIPRYIMMYISAKLEGQKNECAKCCARCCCCCLKCLEKILKFLNQNAYTFIAMKGDNFCKAAKQALSVITNNVLRVAAINSVGAFVLFLGKIGVMASTCAVSVIWLREKEGLHFFAIPVFLISVFAFLCAHCALTVYEMVVDALLLCFCEDCDINKNSPDQYYMNKSLMTFMKNSGGSKRPVDHVDYEDGENDVAMTPNTRL